MPFADPLPAPPPAEKQAPVAWSPVLLGWMGALLTFLPAGVLWALNFGRLGRPEVVRLRLAWIVFLYAVWFIVAVAHPAAGLVNTAMGLYFWQTQRGPVRQSGVRPGLRTPLLVAALWIAFLFVLLVIWSLLTWTHDMRMLQRAP